jgi:hypothetical protein
MIGTEEINDIYITPSYWDNIFNEVTLANILNGARVVYMARVWCQRLNLYFYKIASTENLIEHIKDIHNKYDSCGRIIIIAAANIDNTDIILKNKELEEYELTKMLPGYFPIGREVYRIFTQLLKDNINDTNRFISKDYMFNEKETMNINNQMLTLDCGNMEKQYWADRMNAHI